MAQRLWGAAAAAYIDTMAAPNDMTEWRTVTVMAGRAFEEHVAVDTPGACVAFAFEVSGGANAVFSIEHRTASHATSLALLPASSYSEHSGEVLLPGRGVTVLTWHAPPAREPFSPLSP